MVLLLTAVVWLLLALWPLAAAQGPALVIEQGTLRLWPEYDDPGLLIIFSGIFAPPDLFPQTVYFPLPAGARGIQATVQDRISGELLTQGWEIVDGRLTYTLPQPGFHIEYYLDRPSGGEERTLNYTFEAPYPITQLEVSVQQPARASNFSLQPEPESSFVGSDGLSYHRFIRKAIAAREQLQIIINYHKPDQGVSVMRDVKPETSAVAPTRSSAALWLPFIMIGLGAAGLAGVGLYWLYSRRAEALPQQMPASQPSRKPSQQGDSTVAAYCTQCGRQFGPRDRFCARCGAPRRL